MKLYFVRHGESLSNSTKTFGHSEIELTPKGVRQAKQLANRFKKIPIEIIICSPYKRAKQTAEIVNQTLGKTITYSPLIHELIWPTQIEGKGPEDPKVNEIYTTIRENWANPNWHHSDEENLHDLQKRVETFLEQLNTYTQENILIVSHGYFILMFLKVIWANKGLILEDFTKFGQLFHLDNTGITVFEKIGDQFALLTWNDYAHLEEITKKD